MIDFVSYDYFITALPAGKRAIKTYSSLCINEGKDCNNSSVYMIRGGILMAWSLKRGNTCVLPLSI